MIPMLRATTPAARSQAKLEFEESPAERSTSEGRRALDAQTIPIHGRVRKAQRCTKFVNKMSFKSFRNTASEASTFGRRFSLDASAKLAAQSQERTEGRKRTK
jgi:hypothetical protein